MGELLGGFPTDLFLTLVGVTLLFTMARGNGTLDRVVRAAVRCCRGNAGLIPFLFFGLSCAIASIGAGNIAAAALIAPLAMAVADRAGSSLLDDDHGRPRLHRRGAVADRSDGDHRQRPDGPDGAVGIRAADLPVEPPGQRRGRRPWVTWRSAACGCSASLSRTRPSENTVSEPVEAMTPRHWITLATIAILVVGVVVFRVHVGMGAFAAAVAAHAGEGHR